MLIIMDNKRVASKGQMRGNLFKRAPKTIYVFLNLKKQSEIKRY